MALFPKFPWLNFHDLNLDWILEALKKNTDDIEALQSIVEPASLYITTSGTFSVDSPKVGIVEANVTPLQVQQMLQENTSPMIMSIKLKVNGTVISTFGTATKGSNKAEVHILCHGEQYVDAETSYSFNGVITGSTLGWSAVVTRTA